METDKEILERLKRISIDIKIIKENMPDKEIFLNIEEENLFLDSLENQKNGSLKNSIDLRREVNL